MFVGITQCMASHIFRHSRRQVRPLFKPLLYRRVSTTIISKEQLRTLQTSLKSDQPPYCSGVIIPPHPHNLHLYYGVEKPSLIDFANTSNESLAALTEACDPATFGLGGEDVLDETYRKAVKLDASKFAITFDPVRCNLINTINDQLFQDNIEVKSLDCELSKLNVYDKDAFFKPHKDTPRSENMVGSLVIIFPVPHSGGELVLRDHGNEWVFDGASLITSKPPPSISYIAFYSDVEHEVLKVTSGHRVTITYNLYCLPPKAVDAKKPSAPIVQDVAELTNFKGTLESMLHDKTFMPEGGIIGFGLRYQYPVTYETKMKDLKNKLKGNDVRIWNACSDLGLKPSLWITYGANKLGTNPGRFRVLAQQYYKPDTGRYDEGFLTELAGGYKANIVNEVDQFLSVEAREEEEYGIDCFCSDDTQEWTMQVTWITDLTPASTLEGPIIVYGNEAELKFVYCDPCLLATVKPASQRGCGGGDR